MAFVVEDGTGLATANAYISAANARAYWLEQGVTFAQADTAGSGVVSLETGIIAATRYMEQRFRPLYKGTIQFPPTTSPAFAGQGLSFPRLCLYDVNGYLVTGVPLRIAQACAEYMKRALTAELMPDPTLAGNLTSKTVKAGPVETSFTLVPGTIIIKPYPTADALISEFIRTGRYSYR